MKTFKILFSTLLLSTVTLFLSAQTQENSLSDGTYCYELNDINNSGNQYKAIVIVKNSNVQGDIKVGYDTSKEFIVTFKGTLNGKELKVTAEYSNDVAQLPYDEVWKLSNKSFTGSHQPIVTMSSVGCKL